MALPNFYKYIYIYRFKNYYSAEDFLRCYTAAVTIQKTICKIGKVFYGQEPPSGESTTTECGFNYQLLAVIY